MAKYSIKEYILPVMTECGWCQQPKLIHKEVKFEGFSVDTCDECLATYEPEFPYLVFEYKEMGK